MPLSRIQATRMTNNLAAILFFSTIIAISSAQTSTPIDRIGVNYGKLGSNLPTPFHSIELIKSMKASMVKLYDADPETLKLLVGTDLHVSIMVRNEDIVALAANETLANQWVHENVFAYYPTTMIRYIMVGNEVYSNHNIEQWDSLVLVMQHIRNTLHAHDIHNIKVGTPLAMDILGSTFPPSNGTFRIDTLTTIVPLLQFLNRTGSYFFLDVYPYFPWSSNPDTIDLNFTLFKGNITYVDPTSNLTYTNLLDQMLDSVYFAMSKLGFSNIPIFIAETGWPNQGDLDQPGANEYNAATYNRNLIKKIVADPPIGTPARPGTILPTFLFSLFNENLKDGPKTERYWGLLKPDGTPVYPIDLTGNQTVFGPLKEPTNNHGYKGKLWCVVDKLANTTQLGPALRNTCSLLNGTCESALGPGKHCYEPVSVVWHASYAFNAYWAKFRNCGEPCYFGGLASLTTRNPSHGTCHFPSVLL
ncbi:probable glucan endo-1,3-beta-glucosidase A6 [Chenopodium quinoa]|uniref:probable glucan endo-1,3-beta-glucosidase A6 n=1 Tax=Chenopodium quinoa TaxID=63459 RepID=UPI000B79A3E8|nr:probable glucan endo-1,3-beta-glucosidase A6 [Chenopodium quinoa]